MVDRLNILIGELYARMRREEGQGVVEYALVLGFVVAIGAALAATGTLQTAVNGLFTSITGKL